MVQKEVTVTNPTGFHLRPAGVLCEAAVRYRSHIVFRYNNGTDEASMKSVLSILGAGVRRGDTITLVCDGEDENEALAELSDLIESGFSEKL